MIKPIPFKIGLLTSAIILSACSQSDEPVATQSKMNISDMTVEHMDSPLGIDTSSPRLSWINHADYNGADQTAYEIRVSSDASNSGDIWSSGKISSDDSFNVVYAGSPLTSNTRYYWSVRVWDGETVSDWSTPDWFETAFMDVSEFNADWITRFKQRPETETPEVLLRKEFSIGDKAVSQARLYVSGLGYYKAYINGQRVGDHEIDPAFTPFDERVLYVTYDVTDMLDSNDNAIGVSLGRGFYADYGNIDTEVAPWLSEPKLKLQLVVTYQDGSEETINSDTSWLVSSGPTLTNNVENGEVYDARLEQPGWNDKGFNTSNWSPAVVADTPTGLLQAQDLEPVRVLGELPSPVSSKVTDDITLYDFQTTRAGWATLTFKGNAGDSVTIRYGEKLSQDGTVNTGNDGPFGGTPLQTYTYILSGDPEGESYTPSYSYSGYRFVEVEAPASVEVTDIKGLILHNDVAQTGSFDSSDALLNRYHKGMVQSLYSNLHNIPTDTPMYEKRGWAADALLMVDSALMNIASENFWEKWMLDHKYNQAADGGLAVIVPNQNPGEPQPDPFTGLTNDPIWSSSYVLVNYALYHHRGNIRTLEENYDGMKLWMTKWMNELAQTGYVHTGTTWGDHEPAYGSGKDNLLVSTAIIYHSTSRLAEIADALGHTADADQYREFADKVKNAMNEKWFDQATALYDFPFEQPVMGPPPGMEDQEVPPGFAAMMARRDPPEVTNAKQVQTDNILPVAYNMEPEGYRQATCEALIKDMAETQDNHITSGATVLKEVMPVMTNCGAAELAYKAATNPTFPGWGYWFVGLNGTKASGGETIITDTFWEAWGDGARSHNHAFRGTIDDWMYQYLAGIKATSPGYETISIKPYPVGELTYANASIKTPLGDASSSWKRSADGFELEVQIPVGATADIYVPMLGLTSVTADADVVALDNADAGYSGYQVESGTYHFNVR